jgi:cation:H+ antiporter
MTFDYVLLLVGMGVVFLAADRIVLSSGTLATRWGISPVIVGAIIIGFGSSLPEMLVSVLALDQPNGLDLAVGNVVGSNIANMSLVLGVSVVFFPFRGQADVIKREGLLMVGALILVTAFLWDENLQAWEGALLVLGLVLAATIVTRLSEAPNPPQVPDQRLSTSNRREAVTVVAGLIALIAGARAMVIGAEHIALELGLAEGVVGLTILAMGTSLPELGTVIASARRGRNDLVLGNVLGSNLFNALGVAGISGIFGSGALTTDFRADLVLMLVVAVVAGVAAWSGDRLRRLEGALLLAAYPLAVGLAL